MTLILFILLGLQSLAAIKSPKTFLIIYFLFVSRFFGLIGISSSFIGGDSALVYQQLLMMLAFVINSKGVFNYKKSIFYICILLMVPYLYGILRPVALGMSGFASALLASKEYTSIFLVHYLFAYRSALPVRFVYRLLSVFSLYYLFVLLGFQLFEIVPPEYEKSLNRVEFFHPTWISLYLFARIGVSKTWAQLGICFLLIAVWLYVMPLNDHSAILLTTTIGCLLVLVRSKLMLVVASRRKALIACALIVVVSIMIPWERVVDYAMGHPSFSSRALYFGPRIEFIEQEPWLGYGFVHKNAVQLSDDNIYMESLSFIDGGYIDLLIKYGILGGCAYLLLLSFAVFRYQRQDLYTAAMKIFFLQYFVISITWSVFSYSMGLMCIGILIYFLDTYEYA